jgi:hypothetical protein
VKAVTTVLVALMLALVLCHPLAPAPGPGLAPETGMRVGYTFSPRQADYLELPWQETFDATLALDPGLLRLGAYWDEIEPHPGHYDFSSLDWQMDRAAATGRPVVLTVGMKAPRWPEYFLPAWLGTRLAGRTGAISDDPELQARTLRFVQAVVERYRSHPALRYWQVENEPLDPAGPRNWFIRPAFLAQEIATVRAADPSGRPIVLNMFVHVYPFASLLPWSRGDERRAETLLGLGDVLGLDVYPSVSLRAFGLNLYFNFMGWNWAAAARAHAERAHARGKQAWIMEAQAEPWEPAQVVAAGPQPARSLNAAEAERIFERLRGSGFDTILVWGVEHWYMRKEVQQDSSWWDAGRQVLGTSTPLVAHPR